MLFVPRRGSTRCEVFCYRACYQCQRQVVDIAIEYVHEMDIKVTLGKVYRRRMDGWNTT